MRSISITIIYNIYIIIELVDLRHVLLPRTAKKTNATAKTYVQQRQLDRVFLKQTEIMLATVLASGAPGWSWVAG